MNRRRRHLALLTALVLMGFLATLVARGRPGTPNPADRLPRRFELAGLIEQEQATVADLRRQVDQIRSQIAVLQTGAAGRTSAVAALQTQITSVGVLAGLTPVHGPGLTVILDDSDRRTAPSGDVNDLVIHSQDVQAVVNALWRSGAEALDVNGQRLLATSAILCVGNTLLLNGTVNSPPYRISAVGAVRDRFDNDLLVRRLHRDAGTFGLRFSVGSTEDLQLPGATAVPTLLYAHAGP